MEKVRKKINSIFYNLSTEDRYAGFNSDQGNVQSPFQTKLPNRSSAYINASLTQYPEENMASTDDLAGSSSAGGSALDTEGVTEVNLAWRHIQMWTSKYQPDLHEALSSPCTRRDLDQAQKDLQITFPECVRASLMIHDGQDELVGTQGLVFGLELMDLDSIVKMTRMWRKVADRLMSSAISSADTLGAPQSSHPTSNNISTASKINNLQESVPFTTTRPTKPRKMPPQHSIPPGAVQQVYAHHLWIPLLTDNAGNHVGIDLAPGPTGKKGQVIVFGREFDTKYVLAPNWGDFLLIFANDVELKNWRIVGGGNDEEDEQVGGTGEVFFYDKKTGRDRLYLSVLVERCMKKNEALLSSYKKKAEQKLARTPDLIDASSPVVNELEVFPDNNIDEQISEKSDVEVEEEEEEEEEESPESQKGLEDVEL